MPVVDGIVWQKSDDENGKFVLRLTGEKFSTESAAKSRLREYKKQKWLCRHLPDASTKHTFKEAYNLEERALQSFCKRYPGALIIDLCRAIHHAYGEMKNLVNDMCGNLNKHFYNGETVIVTQKDMNRQFGIICSTMNGIELTASQNNKENACFFCVEIEARKVITDIAAENIRRIEPIMECDVSSFLLLVAYRETDTSPWVLDESIRRGFSIPDKLQPLSLGNPSSKCTDCTCPLTAISNESNSEANKSELSETKTNNVSNETKLKRPIVVTPSVDDSDKEQKQQSKKLCNGISEKLNSKDGETTESAIRETENRQNKSVPGPAGETTTKLVKEAKLAERRREKNEAKRNNDEKVCKSNSSPNIQTKNVHLKMDKCQSNLTKYLVPMSSLSSSAIVSPRNFEARKLEASVNLQTKSLIAHDSASFSNAREVDVHKNMSAEISVYTERIEEERSQDPVMEQELHGLLNKKLDDLEISTKKFLPELELIGDGASFVSCLTITEFMYSFRFFLYPENNVSAEALIKATRTGKNGFFAVTGHHLIALLRVILRDKRNVDYYAYCSALHKVPVTLGSVSELARLVLSKSRLSSEQETTVLLDDEDSEKCEINATTSSNYINKRSHSQSQLIDRLNSLSFYELTSKEQISVLEQLMQYVLDTDSFNKYFTETLESDLQFSRDARKTAENNVNELTTALSNFRTESKPLDEMSREESFAWSKIEKEKQQTERKLKMQKDGLATAIENLQEMEKVYAYAHRIKPLGYDRFHRRYWFFADSPNKGIFVERGWWSSNASENGSSRNAEPDVEDGGTSGRNPLDKLRRIGTLDEFMKSGISWPAGVESNDWYRIKDVKTLRLLCSDLLTNGYRELSLLGSIKAKWEDIVASMENVGEKEDLKMESDETEMNMLKKNLMALGSSLRDGLFITTEINNVFVAEIESAETVDSVKCVISELADNISQRAFKKLSERSSATSFSLEKWKTNIAIASTFSKLNLLVSILEVSIEWSNSLSRKMCTICCTRRNADKLVACEKCDQIAHRYCLRLPRNKLPLDIKYICMKCIEKESKNTTESFEDEYEDERDLTDELEDLFSKLKQDSRIYRSLLTVPAARRPGAQKATLSLEKIKDNLYNYKSVRQLRKDLLIFLDAAAEFYMDNKWKLPEIQQLICMIME